VFRVWGSEAFCVTVWEFNIRRPRKLYMRWLRFSHILFGNMGRLHWRVWHFVFLSVVVETVQVGEDAHDDTRGGTT